MRRRRESGPHRDQAPIGVILAGGEGTRMGGSKATVHLHGRPLVSYPLEAMWRALGSVAIMAKIDTQLPSVAGVTVWIEPEEPRHPLLGVVHALGLADGRPVMVCPVDLPFVTSGLIRRIAAARAPGVPAVVAGAGGRTQPLLGCYEPEAIDRLTSALGDRIPVREAVSDLGAAVHEVEDAEELFNVNTPDDLLQASVIFDRRRAISRT